MPRHRNNTVGLAAIILEAAVHTAALVILAPCVPFLLVSHILFQAAARLMKAREAGDASGEKAGITQAREASEPKS